MAAQNQYTTISEAAAVAPILLWSDRCQGNVYLTEKNTFLEFYSDENKAIKRSAHARSASADSKFSSSERSTQSTATPTNRSSSPSIRSMLSSDNLEAGLQSPTYQHHDANHNWFDPNATSRNWCDFDCEVMSPAGYPMTMMPMMPPMSPCASESPNQMHPHVVKPRSPKGEAVNHAKPFKKHQLKNLNKGAANLTEEITTLMIRGIPCSYTQEALLALMDDAGLKSKYNFFYLPRDRNRSSNLGYAFINFVDQQSAELCTATFEGVPLSPARSKKSLMISPADIQGFPSLRKHYNGTAVSRGSHGPMFFKVGGDKHHNRKHAVSEGYEARRQAY